MFKEGKKFAVIFLVLTLLLSIVAYLVVTPWPNEQFLNLMVLGRNGMFENYFPDDKPSVGVGEHINWNLVVINNMSSTKFVTIKVRVGNISSMSPDETNCTPSLAPVICEFSKTMMPSESWSFSYAWRILSAEESEAYIAITSLEINNISIAISSVSAKQGHNFRMIFELWTLDSDTGEFVFGWYDQDKMECAWLQQWFNVTRVSAYGAG